ncbi:MAG: twin-arginine translocase TatA/TatE family subunit [Tenuifilum sp.]|uniref:Sec-independent protein translocase subunit TatA/TatB n=1 Tax=Tenuifilum TaxID=2760873 RepID=UPI001B64C826|nr:twin-arginine translocase TatA/TatE family subunit [Bacteroidales bacterium]HOK60445.1 twin-arginine translocase TatA/TatE family subunit [Tenuifilum sp.]MBP9029906.1 twin-arginine translocase TatA/TatE family subunit [Bacteroidales bacterium]HOK85889.1 twin-arginine translocase TatA/TatE family subunit [Tenuifilum sp.]HON70750.1 twin-arginine translocase TatA/TatE family subunit [Tenuifilum sp.]
MLTLFIGGGELLVIAIVILVIFGASKIPIFMRNLGRGVGEFKKGIKEAENQEDKEKE